MSEITATGLDLAKNVFQVHGVDETVIEAVSNVSAGSSPQAAFSVTWL